jgi:hypothetical protein
MAEQRELTRLQRSEAAEFAVVYGRRRVGKTYLIGEHFHDDFCFKVTGRQAATMAEQLAEFNDAVEEYGHAPYPKAATWRQAFKILRQLIEQDTRKGKKVVFLDEMPWLATNRSGFVEALGQFWNSWGSRRKDLLLIVCGSATTWMVDKVLNDTGALHNRVTASIYLQPFTLAECEEFFQSRGIVLSRYQMLESHMIFGGIPYYLSLLKPDLGLAQSVDLACFAAGAPLRNEFANLYAALFKQPDNYLAVVRALSAKAQGLSRDEIARAARIADGGRLTKVLSDLELSGFIRVYHAFGKRRRDATYQLTDPFTLFYLRYMDEPGYRDPHFWSDFATTPTHTAWRGYAFEMVALLHTEQVRRALGIGGVLVDFASWTGTAGGDKAQIDLVLDRSDGIINLCEMKYSSDTFAVDAAYEARLRRKRTVFTRATGTKKAAHLTLVTTYGLEHNAHAAVFQSVVTMADLFTASRGNVMVV